MNRLNLFYEEPDPDRWIRFDRYPRRILRRVARGQPRVGGHKRLFLNLCRGLDRLGIEYQVNDCSYISSHSAEAACIIGKPCVLETRRWRNPLVVGPALYSHPIEYPSLLKDFPNIQRILVPGEWMRRMCEPYWGDKVVSWPVGIDTDYWRPNQKRCGKTDFLIYDKVRWDHDRYEAELLAPVRGELQKRERTFITLSYGHYRETEYQNALACARAMIFVCEHETQGLAYQEALACDVPVLAWDRGGYWRDPAFFPRVQFGPVSSVPYWDGRCGMKFSNFRDFTANLDEFIDKLDRGEFSARRYILENLTLEQCAQNYVKILEDANK